ncbi:MAG: hypothetical protein R3D52_11370 [Xanthobacteraceae bacterium]
MADDDIVHNQELDAPAARLCAAHSAGGHLEGGEQRGGAIALVIVAVACQRPPFGASDSLCSTLQRLDRRLFVDADDDRILAAP